MKIQLNQHTMTIPIIQGGMGVGVSLGNLAGHVALNGGMGVISTAHPGYRADDFLKNTKEANVRELQVEIKKAKEIANNNGIVAINAMVAIRDYELMIKAALDAKVDAIISGAGLPLNLPALVKGHDVLIAPIVSSKKALAVILKSWQRKHQRVPDFIVIEGALAGGHLGFHKEDLLEGKVQSLEAILIDVLELLKQLDLCIPVFVAGGIYTGQDIRKYIDLGATGVQMATRFITTNECDASLAYKQAFLQATTKDIDLVKSPVGMPGRAIKNKLTEKLEKGQRIPIKHCFQCLIPCDPKTTPYCISGALIDAVKGNKEEGLFFSGSNGYLNKEIISVKRLIKQLMEECYS
ncbi:NAD(P)H-dependent flavin oxidoreductase [Tannockella kyphosi]|uniref:NAD(P)H-dependent flavin oxidoreductase n=1 Tax=Tannockella kyphosi TaxID=2899121 RepID=UPI0020138C7C|nr:nitronate monooxygenase family protein [Tannockella kyphosi]